MNLWVSNVMDIDTYSLPYSATSRPSIAP